MMSAHKTAAVVASTAALAGGGVAVQEGVPGLPDRERPARAEQVTKPAERADPPVVAPDPSPPAPPDPKPEPQPQPEPDPAAQAAKTTVAEFGPERAAAEVPAKEPDPAPATESFGAPAGAPAASASGGEFGP
jgi:hypothetical protein